MKHARRRTARLTAGVALAAASSAGLLTVAGPAVVTPTAAQQAVAAHENGAASTRVATPAATPPRTDAAAPATKASATNADASAASAQRAGRGGDRRAVPTAAERRTITPRVVRPSDGRLSSGFGPRWGRMHKGLDFAAPIGTPIRAAAAGTIVEAGPSNGYGLVMRIRHDDGTVTVYGHMDEIRVDSGKVKAGQVIATTGNRGRSTGPHLHFEVIVDGEHVDPVRWLRRNGVSV